MIKAGLSSSAQDIVRSNDDGLWLWLTMHHLVRPVHHVLIVVAVRWLPSRRHSIVEAHHGRIHRGRVHVHVVVWERIHHGF